MATNITPIDASTNIAQFAQGVNTASGDLLTLFILAAIFLFGLLAMRRYGWDKAFTASSFITALIGILFVYLEMIAFEKVTYVVVAFILSLIFTIWNLKN